MTWHSDTISEFDKLDQISKYNLKFEDPVHYTALKSFVSIHFSDNRILLEKLEKMKIDRTNNPTKSEEKEFIRGDIREYGYNQALEDIKNFLKDNNK